MLILGIATRALRPKIVFEIGTYNDKGRFRPLADYLENLSREVPIYRVGGTTLAWAPAGSLRQLVSQK